MDDHVCGSYPGPGHLEYTPGMYASIDIINSYICVCIIYILILCILLPSRCLKNICWINKWTNSGALNIQMVTPVMETAIILWSFIISILVNFELADNSNNHYAPTVSKSVCSLIMQSNKHSHCIWLRESRQDQDCSVWSGHRLNTQLTSSSNGWNLSAL